MPEFVGFQSMGILVPYGIPVYAVGVFGLAFHLLFKSCSTYCVPPCGALKSEILFNTFFDGDNRKCSFLEFENYFFTS
jgi:hypothetical protein